MPKQSVKNNQVIILIQSGVAEMGVNGFARAAGISPALVSRYLSGKVGETSHSVLQKLANHFKVTFTIEIKPEDI